MYRYPVPNTELEMYYDVWSNIHFGYVGRAAGYSEETLQEGGYHFLAGANDGVDVISTEIGSHLYELYPPDAGTLTPELIHDEILSRIYDMVDEQATDSYQEVAGENACTPPGNWQHVVPLDDGI